jgi:hypothetical protein
VGYSPQYMYDNSAAVGGNILSLPAIGVFTQPRPGTGTQGPG